MPSSSFNPQKDQGGYSPLRELAVRALRDLGDLSSDRADGDTLLSMIDYGNQVLELVMSCPYWEGGTLDYYKSLDDVRPVPDIVIKLGLMAFYADDEGDKKSNGKMRKFAIFMNRTLYRLKFGPGHIQHEFTVKDKDEDGYVKVVINVDSDDA